MSDIALLTGVETRLRSAAVFNDAAGKFVGIQPDGAPPHGFGQWYAGVNDQGYASVDTNPLSLDERYDVVVVVTMRMDYAPKDRRGARMQARDQMRELSRKVVLALHANYDVLVTANTAIGASANGFIEPLSFVRASAVSQRGPEWYGADGAAGDANVYVREISFGGARRVQKIEGAT